MLLPPRTSLTQVLTRAEVLTAVIPVAVVAVTCDAPMVRFISSAVPGEPVRSVPVGKTAEWVALSRAAG